MKFFPKHIISFINRTWKQEKDMLSMSIAKFEVFIQSSLMTSQFDNIAKYFLNWIHREPKKSQPNGEVSERLYETKRKT